MDKLIRFFFIEFMFFFSNLNNVLTLEQDIDVINKLRNYSLELELNEQQEKKNLAEFIYKIYF